MVRIAGRKPSRAQPIKRRGYWFLARRVPKHYTHFDARGVVFLNTGIRVLDDPGGRAARPAVRKLDEALQLYWREQEAGASEDARARYELAVDAAKALGIPYAPVSEIETMPTEVMLGRLQKLLETNSASAVQTAAVLGGMERPTTMVSELADIYEKALATTLIGASEAQKTKWRQPKDTALAQFIAIIGGDRAMQDLTAQQVRDYRAFWEQRTLEGEVQIDTANKNIGRIGAMFNQANETLSLGLPRIFDRMKLRGFIKKQRMPFATEMIASKILAEGMFEDLNAEARAIMYLMVETGLRPSEICNLTRKSIRLSDEVPHVQVRAEDRKLKTPQSRRDVPLVGVSLMAAQAFSDGFARYRDNADSLSALINKALRVRKIAVEKGHSLYSLRHSFEDRLYAAGATDKLVAHLMGHKYGRETYGLGFTLEFKREILARMALPPPTTV